MYGMLLRLHSSIDEYQLVDVLEQQSAVIETRALSGKILKISQGDTPCSRNCQDVRPADEELCVYLSAIMTWLLLPANSICSE